MGTAITPQLVDVVDIVTAVRSYSSGTARQLRTCQEERWGLRTECPTPEDPFYDSEVTWLLPEERVRAQSILWLGARWAGAFTPVLVVKFLELVTWRQAFECARPMKS